MHAIECRINAEDPYNDFRPSPGRITTLHVPGGHGVRVDTHIYSGYLVPPHYDSMIAKLITVAQTREEAIATMERALSEFVVEGIKTTIPFHLQMLKDPNFIAGQFNTQYLNTWKMQ
jgi:acetyl-CoA carboxylase biotin carboxylase subunit